MPYRPPLYGIFLGHIFCQYGGWGWSELFSLELAEEVLAKSSNRMILSAENLLTNVMGATAPSLTADAKKK